MAVQRQAVLQQRRIEGDLERQCRRDGDDGVARRDRDRGALDDDVIGPLADGAHRRVEADGVAELGGDAARSPAPPTTRFSW
ncbi:MAG: hypothetical protein U0802_22890 [Candidatus Binatia bacterium]